MLAILLAYLVSCCGKKFAGGPELETDWSLTRLPSGQSQYHRGQASGAAQHTFTDIVHVWTGADAVCSHLLELGSFVPLFYTRLHMWITLKRKEKNVDFYAPSEVTRLRSRIPGFNLSILHYAGQRIKMAKMAFLISNRGTQNKGHK